jgi:hypothetical protein
MMLFKQESQKLKTFGILICTTTVLYGCFLPSSLLTSRNDKKETSDTSWVPSGFTPQGDNVAYKSLKPGEYSCDYGLGCYKVKVITKDGCSNLFAQASVYDENGNNVGFANDMRTNLSAGEIAIMTMNITEKTATNIKISEIKCL